MEDINRLSALLDARTMALMERESDLADRMEEIEAQKEELTAAVDELHAKNKVLESALAELKERNQELDQILYRASHDLRSPITSIIGILNLLTREPLTPALQECFRHIRDQSAHMDELLKSLSTLSKTISNDIHYTRVNLEDLVRSCLKDLQYLPDFSSVAIRSEMRGLPEVNTDKLLLSILIKNLVTNALMFRHPTRAGWVLIRLTGLDSYLEMEVIDNGEGIPDVVKDRVFDMFYRGSERSTGSGLGLYIVRKIVDQLRGHIQFTSDEGLTRFKVVLPQAVENDGNQK